jgi:gas vesicle protein
MKLLLPLILVGVIVCLVLFIAALLSPPRSHRLQEFTGRWFRKGEDKSDESAGRMGDMTREALGITRRATETSADAGREIHEKVSKGRSNKQV